MRVAALLLLLLAVLAPVEAQEAAPKGMTAILQDDPGDVAATGPNSTPLGNPGGRMGQADLTALEVEETPLAFVFRVSVSKLADDPGQTFAESLYYQVSFRQVDTVYILGIWRQPDTPSGSQYGGWLDVYDPAQDSYQTIARPPLEVDATAGTMTMTLARDLLLDSHGAKPFPGNALDNFHAVSGWAFNGIGFGFDAVSVGNAINVADRMPDEGNGTVTLPIKYGVAQTGFARLYSDIPTRASNGEATTIVYSVQAVNIGTEDDTYRLDTVGVPADWTVRLPASRVELPAGSNVTFPVLLSIPFDHKHGSYRGFTVELKSETDPATTGRVELGVRFTTIPQPTGHHSTVWLHSRLPSGDRALDPLRDTLGFGGPSAYFNAQPEDTGDALVNVPGQQPFTLGPQVNGGTPSVTYTWWVPLQPALELGVDVDMAKTGAATIPIASQIPISGAVLSGDIVHFMAQDYFDVRFGGEGGTTIVQLGPSDPTDVDADGTAFEGLPITPMAGGDFIAFEEGAALALRLNLTFLRADIGFIPNQMAPQLQPGGELLLPLSEYHDPVDDVFATLAELEVVGAADRKVNPGETAVYELKLKNFAEADQTFHITVAGVNSAWAHVTSGGHVKVPGSGELTVHVVLAAPAGTAEGTAADLVVEAASMDDLSVRALARLFATVTELEDLPDEKGRADQLEGVKKKDSPAPAGLLLLGLLAALAAVRRR